MLTKKLMGAGGAGGAAAAGAWTFVDQGLSYADGGQTVTVSGWGLIEHDLLLYSYVGRSAPESPYFTPTQSGLSVLTGYPAYAVQAWYFVPATPPTTITINNNEDNGVLLVQAWRHTTGTALADGGYSTASGTSGMPNPPSTTNSYTDVLVVAFGGVSLTPVTDVTAPSGYSNLYDEYDQETDYRTAMIASKVAPNTGAQDPAAFGGSGSGNWGASTVIFRVA